MTSVPALCREGPANPPGQALPAGSRLLVPCSVLPPAFPLSRVSVHLVFRSFCSPPDPRGPVRPPRRRRSAAPPRPASFSSALSFRFDRSDVSLTKPAPPALSQASSFVHDFSSSALSPRALHSCSSTSSSESELQTGKQPPEATRPLRAVPSRLPATRALDGRALLCEQTVSAREVGVLLSFVRVTP